MSGRTIASGSCVGVGGPDAGVDGEIVAESSTINIILVVKT